MTEETNKTSDMQEDIYKLADELSALIVREHQMLQGEMRQVRVLVGDAVKNIDGIFRNLSANASEQTAILDQVLESGHVDKGQHQKLSEISNQVNSHTSTTIRVLQFDDIVQQLAGHTCDRIARMQELFAELEKNLTKIKLIESRDDVEIQKHLKKMHDEVEHFRVRLEKENPVKQDSMKAGKIELF
jgi:hypothetical protein